MKKLNHGEIVKPAFDRLNFLEIFKNLENCLSRKLKGFGYSYMEARIAKPGKTLAISYNWVANFNWLDEINTESIGK